VGNSSFPAAAAACSARASAEKSRLSSPSSPEKDAAAVTASSAASPAVALRGRALSECRAALPRRGPPLATPEAPPSLNAPSPCSSGAVPGARVERALALCALPSGCRPCLAGSEAAAAAARARLWLLLCHAGILPLLAAGAERRRRPAHFAVPGEAPRGAHAAGRDNGRRRKPRRWRLTWWTSLWRGLVRGVQAAVAAAGLSAHA